jgi:hypothetical protein
MEDASCFKCEEPDAEQALRKCPICHKHFCEQHVHRMNGVAFCSRGCGEYFFFGDPDD